jgi:hypothetical protein
MPGTHNGAVHDPVDRDLPVDLLATDRAQHLEHLPTPRANPLTGRHIMDLITRGQMRAIPTAVPDVTRALAPLGTGSTSTDLPVSTPQGGAGCSRRMGTPRFHAAPSRPWVNSVTHMPRTSC